MTLASVKVAVRVRCLSTSQEREESRKTIQFDPNSDNQLTISNRPFSFDHVFRPEVNQGQVYAVCVVPLFEKFLQGQNATILAYGQTGSGKTYSMGTGQRDNRIPGSEGIIPRFADSLFEHLQALPSSQHSYGVQVTFLELANEVLIDLLKGNQSYDTKLQIRKDELGNVRCDGVREITVTSARQLLERLNQGSDMRKTGETDMNLTSSRSHAIFSVILRQDIAETIDGQNVSRSLVSKFHFVDLAGSERLKRTHAVGERAKEGIAINSELSALGNVISALGSETKRGAHIPYRDSKLTHLLKDSLGGNSQTLMLVCASPAYSNLSETLNTLQYASRARNIKNRIHINQEMSEVDRLKAEIIHLRHKLRMTVDATALYDKIGSENTGEKPAFAVYQDMNLHLENDEMNAPKTWGSTSFVDKATESVAPSGHWAKKTSGGCLAINAQKFTCPNMAGNCMPNRRRPISHATAETLWKAHHGRQHSQDPMDMYRQTLSHGQGYAGGPRARRTEGTFLTDHGQPQTRRTMMDKIAPRQSHNELHYFDRPRLVPFEVDVLPAEKLPCIDTDVLSQEYKLRLKEQRCKYESTQKQLKEDMSRIVAENRQSQKRLQSELQRMQRRLHQSDRLQAKNTDIIQRLAQSVEKEKKDKNKLVLKAKQDASAAREISRQYQRKIQHVKKLEVTVNQREREIATQKKQYTRVAEEMASHGAQMKQAVAMINTVLKKKTFDSKLLAKAVGCVSVRGYLLNQRTAPRGVAVAALHGSDMTQRREFEKKLRLIQRAMSAGASNQGVVSQIHALKGEREKLDCEQHGLLDERENVIHEEQVQQMRAIDKNEPQYMDEYIDLITAKIRYFDKQINQLEQCKPTRPDTANACDSKWMDEEERELASLFIEPEVAYEVARSMLQSLNLDESQQVSTALMEDWVDFKKEQYVKDVMNTTAQQSVMQLLHSMVKMRREPDLADTLFQKVIPDSHFEHGLVLLSQSRKMPGQLIKASSKKMTQRASRRRIIARS